MRRFSLTAKATALRSGRPVEVATHLAWKCWRDECPQRAASLAYTTLLSLVPFLAVAFAMLKGFGGLKPIQQRLESIIFTHLVTTSSLQAAEHIEQFIETAHAGAVGALGLLGFIFTAVSLLNTVAAAFNRVWGVADRRSLKDRFAIFFTLTILIPILFGASISLTATIQQAPFLAWLPFKGMGPALNLLVPFLLTWAGFLLLYQVIPSAPLRLRPALLGSLAAAVAWEFVKFGFEAYVSSVASYGKLYASLGVVPVFLVWVYLSWLIALIGFEFSFFLQHPEIFRGPAEALTPRPASPAEALRVFLHVAEGFAGGGGPVGAAQVADRLRLPEGTAFAALAALEGKGFLARVTAPPETYLPRRSPAGLRVAELWEAMGGSMGAADGNPLARLLAEASAATTRAMGPTSIQDLIDAAPHPGSAQTTARRPADLTGPA